MLQTPFPRASLFNKVTSMNFFLCLDLVGKNELAMPRFQMEAEYNE